MFTQVNVFQILDTTGTTLEHEVRPRTKRTRTVLQEVTNYLRKEKNDEKSRDSELNALGDLREKSGELLLDGKININN